MVMISKVHKMLKIEIKGQTLDPHGKFGQIKAKDGLKISFRISVNWILIQTLSRKYK